VTSEGEMFKKPTIESPAALAELVTGLGGTVVPADTFIFDLPRSKVAEVVPEINKLNIAVKKIGEATVENPSRLFNDQTMVRLQLVRQPEAKGEDMLRPERLRFLFDR
jgi:hypothetical protein